MTIANHTLTKCIYAERGFPFVPMFYILYCCSLQLVFGASFHFQPYLNTSSEGQPSNAKTDG